MGKSPMTVPWVSDGFTGPMIPLVIKKIITMWDSLPASERGFKSEFAKKAWADLLAYEEIKAADEANLSDLLERPYEDLVTEEIIDSLPGPKIEVLESEDDPDKVKVEGVSMDTESTEPTQMEVEGGSVDPVSTKDEVTEDVEMDDSHAQSAPYKKPRTSADPPTTEVKEESGSVDPESFVGLGEDQNVFDNLPKISEEEVQEAMKKQGVWGKQSTYVDPRDIDMARTFSSAPDASKASEIPADLSFQKFALRRSKVCWALFALELVGLCFQKECWAQKKVYLARFMMGCYTRCALNGAVSSKSSKFASTARLLLQTMADLSAFAFVGSSVLLVFLLVCCDCAVCFMMEGVCVWTIFLK